MSSAAKHPTWMEIDLDALDGNIREVQKRVGPAVKIIASVKANAYGHGVIPVAQRLAAAHIEMLATGSFNDAIALREAGINTPILMFGAMLPSAIQDFLQFRLTPTVHNKEMAEAVAAQTQMPLAVFIKVDCGFGRLGIPISKARRFVLDLARRSHVEVVGLYTHLPFFDEAGYVWAQERIAKFEDLVTALAGDGLTIPITQARASAAIVKLSRTALRMSTCEGSDIPSPSR
jgi:alanine racemase